MLSFYLIFFIDEGLLLFPFAGSWCLIKDLYDYLVLSSELR